MGESRCKQPAPDALPQQQVGGIRVLGYIPLYCNKYFVHKRVPHQQVGGVCDQHVGKAHVAGAAGALLGRKLLPRRPVAQPRGVGVRVFRVYRVLVVSI